MHINAKGQTVRLDPRDQNDRTALHILRAITDNKELEALIEPFRGKNSEDWTGHDSTTLDGDDPDYTLSVLEFFGKNAKTTPKAVVFSYEERDEDAVNEAFRGRLELYGRLPAFAEKEEDDFVPGTGKVYAVSGEDEDA